MQGFQITFFTQQDRMHGHTPLAQWLLGAAKTAGIRGATLNGAMQGLGHDGALHAVNMFDLSDQPIQVILIVSPHEADDFFAMLARERVHVFYTKIAADFGILGEDNPAAQP